jgi:hypothetical protein
MKHFKNKQNQVYAFDLDCFDENGNYINEYALKVIEENSLIEITKEEAEAIRNYKSPEQIVEEERLAKLPTQEEILNDKITLRALELITELGLI